MHLFSALSALFLSSTVVNGSYHNYAARSADLDSYESIFYDRDADPEPEGDLLDIWGRGLEFRDAYAMDDDEFPLLARGLADLYIRHLESSLLEDRDIHGYHYARALKAPLSSKSASGGRSPSPPKGSASSGSSANLAFPANVLPDGKQLYAWKRLYTDLKQYNKADGTGLNHEQLMRNTRDHGGHHSSLVVGDGHNFFEMDLQFKDANWIKKTPSGKGYPASAEKLPWVPDAKMNPKFKMGPSTHTFLGPLKKTETVATVMSKGLCSLMALKLFSKAILKRKANFYIGREIVAKHGDKYDPDTMNCAIYGDELYKATKA